MKGINRAVIFSNITPGNASRGIGSECLLQSRANLVEQVTQSFAIALPLSRSPNPLTPPQTLYNPSDLKWQRGFLLTPSILQSFPSLTWCFAPPALWRRLGHISINNSIKEGKGRKGERRKEMAAPSNPIQKVGGTAIGFQK